MKYDAFISYRHLEKDMFVAKGIHKALETTKIPGKIQKLTGKKKIQRVFRDQEELPIGSDLGENIQSALSESEYLVVICSPQTKESVWVMKEIDTFIEMHGRSKILAVLVEGEPYESFPSQILVDDFGCPVEPLAADVRGADKKEISRKIKSECMRLAAAIIGCEYDDLRQRHRERIMRRYVAVAAAIAAVSVVFGIYNAYNLQRINENYQQKLINESRVLAKTSSAALKEGDRKAAALVAVEGLPHDGNDRPFVAETMHSLSQALGSYKIIGNTTYDKLIHHDWEVEGAACNPEGTRMVSYDEKDGVYYWDLNTGELLFKLSPEFTDEGKASVVGVGLYESGIIVVTSYYVRAYDEKGEVIYSKEVVNKAEAAEFNSDYSRVAVGAYRGMTIYDCETGDIVGKYEIEDGLGFSYDVTMSRYSDAAAMENAFGHFIGVYDAGTDKYLELPYTGESFLAYRFTLDGGFVVASYTQGSSSASGGLRPAYIQKYDLKTGQQVFEVEYNVLYDSFITPSLFSLASRAYEMGGVRHREIIFRAYDQCVVMDLDSGEEIAHLSTENSFYSKIVFSANSDTIFACTLAGEILPIGILSDTVYSDDRMVVSGGISDIFPGQGRIVTINTGSPDATVLSDLADEHRDVMDRRNWSYLRQTAFSPSKETYTLSGWASSELLECVVYRSSDDSILAEFGINCHILSSSLLYYLDEDTIVVDTNEDGAKLFYYSIKDDKLEEKLFSSDSEFYGDYALSKDGTKIVFYNDNGVLISDVEKRETISGGQVSDGYSDSDIIEMAAVTNDAGTVYFNMGDGVFRSIDVSSGVITTMLEEYRLDAFFLSDDEKTLFASCADGKLRIISLDDKKVREEIDFYGGSDSLVRVSEDGSRMYLIGSDGIFRIYDLGKHDFIYEADDTITYLMSMEEDVENGLLVFRDQYYMYFYDLESLGFLGEAEYGVLYKNDSDRPENVISYYGGNIYRFKMKTLEDLLEEVKEQFGDEQITPSQKRKYNIG
ncbi:toll/interleukin-1 receptor domain-containing protein [Butyrivibrio sp. MC2021]|uniref:toll/interleukin-1 receptor domain-containing protein n=1 Tax=Butyrivibrio sp. MC2021 TaxID=1408306 RepID=UPI000478C968|nr:toll/interleukin-1 receptor domain-containing protein [Butyrivibrio sp. MC2021]